MLSSAQSSSTYFRNPENPYLLKEKPSMSLTEVPPEQLTAILARAEALKQQRFDEDKCRDDFEHFSQFLQIRPKGGSLVPFVLNPAQQKILRAIEEQRARTGRIRTIILKGRQVGCTTLVAGLHFHRMVY